METKQLAMEDVLAMHPSIDTKCTSKKNDAAFLAAQKAGIDVPTCKDIVLKYANDPMIAFAIAIDTEDDPEDETLMLPGKALEMVKKHPKEAVEAIKLLAGMYARITAGIVAAVKHGIYRSYDFEGFSSVDFGRETQLARVKKQLDAGKFDPPSKFKTKGHGAVSEREWESGTSWATSLHEQDMIVFAKAKPGDMSIADTYMANATYPGESESEIRIKPGSTLHVENFTFENDGKDVVVPVNKPVVFS